MMIAHVSCRRSGIPADYMVQGSDLEVLARGFGYYGGKYFFNVFLKFTVLISLQSRKLDIPSDPPKYLPNHASLPTLEDHTSLSDMRQKDQTQTQLYPPRLVREAY